MTQAKELAVATGEHESPAPRIAFLRHIPQRKLNPYDLFKLYPDYERRGPSYVTDNLGPTALYEANPESLRDRDAGSNLAVDLVVRTGKRPDIVIAVRSHLREPKREDPNAQREAVQYRQRLAKLGLADATTTPDNSPTFSAACSSFIYALDWLRRTDPIGANVLMVIDETDYRKTLLPPQDDAQKTGLLMSDFAIGLQGEYGTDFTTEASETHYLPAYGSLLQMKTPPYDTADPYLHVFPPPYENNFLMQGPQLRKRFNREITKNRVDDFLAKAGVAESDIAGFFSHQASIGMVRDIYELLPNIPYKSEGIRTYGNTSSASIPLDYEDAIRSGHIQEGDIVYFLAFGGGLTWGQALIRHDKEPLDVSLLQT